MEDPSRVAGFLAPESRHNRHVTVPEDLRGIAGWSREDLYRAVTAADDGEDGLVVVDYGRSALYLASGANLTYRPPKALWIAGPPELHVADPRVYDPADGSIAPHEDAVISPEFDVLVPAFDWEELDAEDLPPVVTGPSESPSGTGTGTPR